MGLSRQSALVHYLNAMARKERIDAVVRWAESVPEADKGYKLTVYRQVGSLLPVFDHEAGLRWCQTHCDGPYGKDMRNLIARRWARHDGAAALEWLYESSHEDYERDVAVMAAFTVWGQLEHEAALGWMAARTPGASTR